VRLLFMAIINPITVNTIIRISKSVIAITSFSAVDWRLCNLSADWEAINRIPLFGQAQMYLITY